MDKKNRELRDLCVDHWQTMRDLSSPIGAKEQPTGSDCPFCREYMASGCQGCPIWKKTGLSACQGSPYGQAFYAWREWLLRKRSSYQVPERIRACKKRWKEAAQEMIDFLNAL